MDSGTSGSSPKHVWYEQGFNQMKPQTGLPPAGIPFQSQSHSNHWYVLAPYTNLNTILLPSFTNFSGQFSLSSPAAFSELSFLVSASWGGANLDVIVRHEDQTSQTNTIRVNDWADSTNYAWIAHGRFDLATRRFDTVDTNHWRMYARQIAITNTTSPITHVDFARGPLRFGERVAIFGVSGLVGNEFTPIAVSGFNHDVVIEATYMEFTIPNLRGGIGAVSPMVEVGGPASALLNVRNDGNAASPPTKVGLYLRGRNDPYDETNKVAEIDIPPLEPTGEYNYFPVNFVSPSGVGGVFDLSFWIDPQSEVPELSESDNRGYSMISIGPDLVLSVMKHTLLTNRHPFEVQMELWITSGGTAAAATRGAVYLGPLAGSKATNGLKVAEFDVGPLAAGIDSPFPRHTNNLSVTIPRETPAGTYYLTVHVDSEYQLPEQSESNNFFPVHVQIPAGPPAPGPTVDVLRQVEVDEDNGPIIIPYKLTGFNLPTVYETISFPVPRNPFGSPTFEGTGTDRIMVLPLKTNENGQSSIELAVNDATMTVRKTIVIMIRPANDPFSFEPIEDRILAAGGRVTIPLEIDDPDAAPAELQHAAVSDKPELLAVDGLKLEAVNGELSLVLASTNRTGTSQITITLSDGETTRSESFNATFASAGLYLETAGDPEEIEITAASLVPASVEVSRDLVDWTVQQSLTAGHGVKLRRPAGEAEFFRLLPTE